MTTVTGDVGVGGGVSPETAGLPLSFVSVRPVATVTVGGTTLLPHPDRTPIAPDGTFSVEVTPLPAGFAYEWIIILGGGVYMSPPRITTVPGSGTVAFADLVDVVPAPGTSYTPPSWYATMIAARDETVAARDVVADIFAGTTASAVAASVEADRILAQAARDQALAAVGLVASGGSVLAHTGVAWYESGAASPDSYQALSVRGADAAALAGNTGYGRQDAGVPVNPAAQSRMRRCVLHDDGDHVVHYLDTDDSTKIAGVWDAGVQTGWVRVHEGTFDPVRPIPGQAGSGSAGLRAGVEPYAADRTYAKGVRVLHGGSLWDSLADNQLGVEPAPGAAAADLTGAAGQVMVEIPRFYYRAGYDAGLKRHAWEVVFDQADHAPHPLLTDDPDLPASKIVNGRVFQVHPAFQKAGVERRARYFAAFAAVASNTGDNGSGVLQSICDGSSVNTVSVSPTNYRAKARNRNTGLSDPSGQANDVWQMSDYWLHHALTILFVTEYRTLHSQGVLGGGNISGLDYTKVTGRSVPLGNASGQFNSSPALTTPNAGGDSDGMLYRGLEDLWGTSWWWIDGWNVQVAASGLTPTHYVANTPSAYAFDTASGYEMVGVTPDYNAAQQYPVAFLPGTFLAAATGGSSSTYVPDGYWQTNAAAGWRVMRLGAGAIHGAGAGLFALSAADAAGTTSAGAGAALAR